MNSQRHTSPVAAVLAATALTLLAGPVGVSAAHGEKADAATGSSVVSAAVSAAARSARPFTVEVNAASTLPSRGSVAVSAGTRVTVDVSGSPARKGQKVLLQVAGKRWRTVGAARADRNGGATLALPTARPGRATYRVAVPVKGSSRPVVSESVAVVVRSGAPAPAPAPAPSEPATQDLGSPADFSLFDTGRPGSVFRWNPCAAIGYQVDLGGLSPAYEAAVTRAVDDVATATGLTFHYLGTTQYRGSVTDPAQASWPEGTDLLVTVAGEQESATLAGSTIGFASLLRSAWVGADARIGRAEIVLEREFLSSAASADMGAVRELVMHELGHAVGLAHAGDASQVMYPSMSGRANPVFQAGDRAGLARVGAAQGCLA